VAQLCQYQDILSELDVRVFIISFGAMPAARAWLQETCTPFRLLLDPERAVYRAYGLERSWRRSWNLNAIRRYVQLMRAGRRWRGIQGDSAQLGGDFIIDSGGDVRLAYHSHDPADRPPAPELLALLRQLSTTQQGEGAIHERNL